jgi:hypothetical protein
MYILVIILNPQFQAQTFDGKFALDPGTRRTFREDGHQLLDPLAAEERCERLLRACDPFSHYKCFLTISKECHENNFKRFLYYSLKIEFCNVHIGIVTLQNGTEKELPLLL